MMLFISAFCSSAFMQEAPKAITADEQAVMKLERR